MQGTSVLDLADEKAGFCSKLLADIGARVIKVESPAGDTSRQTGTFYKNSPSPKRSLFFDYNNTNKSRITLDLAHHSDQETFCKLIKRTDIVIETFAPGYLENLGLGFEAIHKLNPGLILVSVTGFGQDGPQSKYKSCDIVAAAVGGQMAVNGTPTTPPLKPFGEQSYYTASLFAAVGIMLALRRRAQTGIGEHLDISLQEAVVATLEHVMVRYYHEGLIANRQGNLHWNNAFFISPCKDGHILMTLFHQWETLVEWLDSEGMAEDLTEKKWRDQEYRQKHSGHIIKVLERWSRTHTRDELFALGQLMRYPWAPVLSPNEVLNSPQLKSRNFFIEMTHPETETSPKYPGAPYTFLRSSIEGVRPAPDLGENSEDVLQNALNFLGEASSLKNPLVRVSQKEDSTKRPVLKGLRILDFTWMLAGPFATRILADFGAEVIKVQSKKTAGGAEANLSGYFTTWNRNKRGITLDMGRPEAREIALKLTAESDVVIDNFSPRVMSNWGLDYEALAAVKPDLIMLTMSGMGHAGPWKDYVAFAPTIQALSGLTYLTSFTEDSPLGLGYSYADIVAGLYAAFALLAALASRERTGLGEYIEVSEYESLCTLLGPTFLDVSCHNRRVVPQGNCPESLQAAPYGCYPCRGTDRWCVIAVFSDEEWLALCHAMGHPAWTKKEQFTTCSGRREHLAELDKFLALWTAGEMAEEIVRSLQEAGVPAGIVQNAEALAGDPHLSSRRFFTNLNHPVLGNMVADAFPVKFSKSAASEWKAAPLLGEANQYVYRELLGMSRAELTSYIEKGIIC